MSKTVWTILGIALLLRIAAALYLGNEVSGLSGAHDEITYSMLGQRYAEGHGLTFPENWYPWIKADTPQSYFSATMSLSLAAIYSVVGYQPVVARLVMAFLSVAVLSMIYLLSRRLFGERAAIAAIAAGAVYAYFIFYGVALVTETPFILALLVSIWLAYELVEEPSPGKWIALGVALAVTLLLRMAVVFYVPVLIGWILLRRREWTKWAAVPLAVIGLALTPFIVRNYQLWGEFALSETQFGHVFWNGNHPGHNGNFHPFKVFPIPEDVLALDNDVLITKKLLAMGVESVLADPQHFLMLTLTRLRELFVFWPTEGSEPLANAMRVLSFGLLWPFALAGIYLIRHRWLELAPLFLFAFIHVGVYASMWTMVRYRMPLDAMFLSFAGVACVALADKLGIRGRIQTETPRIASVPQNSN